MNGEAGVGGGALMNGGETGVCSGDISNLRPLSLVAFSRFFEAPTSSSPPPPPSSADREGDAPETVKNRIARMKIPTGPVNKPRAIRARRTPRRPMDVHIDVRMVRVWVLWQPELGFLVHAAVDVDVDERVVGMAC